MVSKEFIQQLFRLDDKVVLIIGSAQNIGLGMAYALGLSGARVALIDINTSMLNNAADSLRSKGIEVITQSANITKPDEVNSALKFITDTWHKVDIAFNNVGICYGGNAENISINDWQNIINTNLNATFYCCQEEFKIMRPHNYGKIINTASVSGVLIPHPQKISAYNTSKAGVIHMTRSLAAEWAEYGINVNAISPGTIKVPDFNTEEMHSWLTSWERQIPYGRLANIKDLLGAAIYLASPASDYMVGQNMIIDGGHTLW